MILEISHFKSKVTLTLGMIVVPDPGLLDLLNRTGMYGREYLRESRTPSPPLHVQVPRLFQQFLILVHVQGVSKTETFYENAITPLFIKETFLNFLWL